jgi:hypothetical protein
MKTVTRWLLLMMLVLGSSSAWAGTSVSLSATPYQKPGAGKDVVVAVAISQASGVTSMDFAYSYDTSVLTPTGVFLTGFTSGFSLASNLNNPGQVELHLARPAGLFGSGEVAWVTFRVATGVAGGTLVPLSWASANLNGGAIPCVKQGVNLVIGAAPVTIGASLTAFGAAGSQVVVPITATSLSGGSSFDLIVTFDPTVLSASTVQKPSFASCMSLFPNVSVPGTVRISLYGLCSLSGSGPLANIVFNVVGPTGSRTPLNVTRGDIEEERYPSVLADGLFNVCGASDADGDGFSVCAGDCNDANASLHPGAAEACNGIDDDCSGVVDDAAVPVGVPVVGAAEDLGDTVLSWAPVAGATGYDVVRGSLTALASAAGDFSGSTDLCLAENSATPTVRDHLLPPWAKASGTSSGRRIAEARGRTTAAAAPKPRLEIPGSPRRRPAASSTSAVTQAPRTHRVASGFSGT